MSPILAIDGLSKHFGGQPALTAIELAVEQGEFIALLGPSGCGKTTLLRCIAGFLTPEAGTIRVAGEDVTRLPPYRRPLNTVFQNYALFPHMSVAETVAYGPRRQGVAKDEAAKRAAEALELVGLAGLSERLPAQLSGGQQQRVALARAIVNRPQLLLLDEPLSALDLKLRKKVQSELKQIQHRLGIAFLFVTHDQEEAMTLADRIVVLRAGIVEQHGTPLDIYNKPANRFVAGFIGSPKMNFLDVIGANRFNLPTRRTIDAGETLTLGVRPEHVVTGGAAEIDLGALAIIHVEQLGGQTIAYGRLADGQPLNVVLEGQRRINAGDSLPVGAMAAGCHLFASDGLRLNS